MRALCFYNFIVITGIGDKERDEEQNQEEGEEQDKKLKEQNNEDDEQDEEQNKERTRRRRTRNRTEEKEEEQDEEQNEKARTSTRNALQCLPQHVRKTQGVSVCFSSICAVAHWLVSSRLEVILRIKTPSDAHAVLRCSPRWRPNQSHTQSWKGCSEKGFLTLDPVYR